MPGNEVVKVMCTECGGGARNHKVLREFEDKWSNEDMAGGTTYQIVQCQGCDEIRFRTDSWFSEDYDYETGAPTSTIHVYPEHKENDRKPMVDGSSDLPPEVDRIYRETITALNAGTLILAGAGLRAIVEAICMNAKAPGGNLAQKIDGLVKLSLLAQPQAELLHEERYIGNAAVHEIEPPSRKHIEEGLGIVETLLNTLYIARASAERLRESRLKKAAAKKAASAKPPPAGGKPPPAGVKPPPAGVKPSPAAKKT